MSHSFNGGGAADPLRIGGLWVPSLFRSNHHDDPPPTSTSHVEEDVLQAVILIVSPDPATDSGRYVRRWNLKLERDFNLWDYLDVNASFNYARNASNSDRKLRAEPFIGNDWIRINDDLHRSSDGLSAPELLLELLQEFPKYDFRDPQAAEDAIAKIEGRLSEATSFQDIPPTPPS